MSISKDCRESIRSQEAPLSFRGIPIVAVKLISRRDDYGATRYWYGRHLPRRLRARWMR